MKLLYNYYNSDVINIYIYTHSGRMTFFNSFPMCPGLVSREKCRNK